MQDALGKIRVCDMLEADGDRVSLSIPHELRAFFRCHTSIDNNFRVLQHGAVALENVMRRPAVLS